MKLWTGLLILLLAVAGCSYQGEDSPGDAPSDDPAKATPAEPYSPGVGRFLFIPENPLVLKQASFSDI